MRKRYGWDGNPQGCRWCGTPYRSRRRANAVCCTLKCADAFAQAMGEGGQVLTPVEEPWRPPERPMQVWIQFREDVEAYIKEKEEGGKFLIGPDDTVWEFTADYDGATLFVRLKGERAAWVSLALSAPRTWWSSDPQADYTLTLVDVHDARPKPSRVFARKLGQLKFSRLRARIRETLANSELKLGEEDL